MDAASHSAGGVDPEPDRTEVLRALESLRAAVRQRQAELAATGGSGGGDLALELAELSRREFVQEPVPVSPRAFGRVLVFLRKAAFHLGFKWHARAVWAQQNGFNQVAARLLREALERELALRRRLERLEARLASLEERLEAPAVRPAGRAENSGA